MKKICIVTATRAEYGLLRPLILRIKESGLLQMQLLVTGAHLEKVYGETVNEIIGDGLLPDVCVPILDDDTPTGILKTMGNAIRNVGEALQELRPDMLVLLGDRYEMLAIASAAVVLGIPIAHLYGGEVTYGAYDDLFRHAITKLSYLHFTSTEEYRRRVIQMGENPERVFNVGALGVENVLKTALFSKEELEASIQFIMDNTLLVTFHPVTMETMSQREQFAVLLDVLEEKREYRILFTRPNADTHRNELNSMLDDFSSRHSDRVKVVDSLGVLRYLSAMKYSIGVIGNSSSGIIEAPSMRVGTINIGSRQAGRVSADSVIHCPPDKEDLSKALALLSSKSFQKHLNEVKNPYEGEKTSSKIADYLETALIRGYKVKEFYDLKG